MLGLLSDLKSRPALMTFRDVERRIDEDRRANERQAADRYRCSRCGGDGCRECGRSGVALVVR